MCPPLSLLYLWSNYHHTWHEGTLGQSHKNFADTITISQVDSQKNRWKSEESTKIGTLALFDTLFHVKTGHKL